MLVSSEILHLDSPRFRAMCDAILAGGSAIRFRARGLSMQPNILDGDVVLVAPVPFSELNSGEVVLTEAGEGWQLHRIVSVDRAKQQVTTRGDASCQPDSATGKVLGRVIEIERDGRRVPFSGHLRTTQQMVRRFLRRLRLASVARWKNLFSGSAPVIH
jgi:hypothetical protein